MEQQCYSSVFHIDLLHLQYVSLLDACSNYLASFAELQLYCNTGILLDHRLFVAMSVFQSQLLSNRSVKHHIVDFRIQTLLIYTCTFHLMWTTHFFFFFCLLHENMHCARNKPTKCSFNAAFLLFLRGSFWALSLFDR